MIGKFLTLEGPEGSGKSSVLQKIEQKLESKNVGFIKTKEPGSDKDPVCIELREFILNPKRDINKEAEIYLYIADRCQHVNNVILPSLKNGKMVICDRYIDSTYAYQGWGRRYGKRESLDFINYLNNHSTNNLIPDLTIILNVSAEIGFQRLSTKEFGKKDRIEKENFDFFERVSSGFKNLKKEFPNRNIYLIETDDKNLELVFKETWEIIERELL